MGIKELKVEETELKKIIAKRYLKLKVEEDELMTTSEGNVEYIEHNLFESKAKAMLNVMRPD